MEDFMRHKIYKEINESLKRGMQREVDEIVSTKDCTLDEIIERVKQAIENKLWCERLFRCYIFDGVVPDDMVRKDESGDPESGNEDFKISSIFGIEED